MPTPPFWLAKWQKKGIILHAVEIETREPAAQVLKLRAFWQPREKLAENAPIGTKTGFPLVFMGQKPVILARFIQKVFSLPHKDLRQNDLYKRNFKRRKQGMPLQNHARAAGSDVSFSAAGSIKTGNNPRKTREDQGLSLA